MLIYYSSTLLLIFMKKFLLPFQNMVRADLFSSSLAVWDLRSGIFFARLPIPSRALRGEDRIPFELFQEYTANWNFASEKILPRGGCAAARLGFERAFLAKRKRIYQWGQKNFFIRVFLQEAALVIY